MKPKMLLKKHLDVHNILKEPGPGLTASFMALLVIPELKTGDKGFFDVTNFGFTGYL